MSTNDRFVLAVTAYARQKFPAAETRLLKASMAEKLQDMRKPAPSACV